MKKISFGLLLIFITVFPIWEGMSIQYDIIGTMPLGILLIIIWFMQSIRHGVIFDSMMIVPMSFLFISFLLGIFQSTDIVLALKNAFSLLSVILLFIIIVDLISRGNNVDKVLIAYITGMFLFSLTMIYNVLHSITYLGLYNRYSTIGTDPNNFAIMLATALPVLLYFFEKSKKKYKIISFVLLIQFSFLIVSTASRSGVVSMGLIFLFYFLSKMKLNFRNFIYLIVLSWAVVYILHSSLIDFIPIESIERLVNAQDTVVDSEEGGRLFIWKQAIDILSDHWVFGIGDGSFLKISSMQIHNTFLYFYLSGGVIGFFAWLSLWIIEIKYVFFILIKDRAAKEKVSLGFFLLLAFIPLLVGAMTLNWEMRKSIYIIFGIVSAIKLLSKNRKQNLGAE